MPDQDRICLWIPQDNRKLFLHRVSDIIGCRFEDWDWDAIRFGIADADAERGRGFEYELAGEPPVALAFAGADDSARLHIDVVTADTTAAKIDAIARVMQCYDHPGGIENLEILIRIAFNDASPPEQNRLVACDATHLARCPECQDVLAFFRHLHWTDLVRGRVSVPSPLPGSYAGFGFLSVEARAYFFPAYLVMALRQRDADLLDEALAQSKQETWTPLQQELVAFAKHLLKQEE